MIKPSAYKVGDPGSIPGSGRSPGEGNGKPLQDSSCLENSMDRRAWRAVIHGGHRVGHDLATKHHSLVGDELRVSLLCHLGPEFC